MKHELECPACGKNLELDEDFLSGDCECGRADYYWDSIYDEETGEECFEGYDWNIIPIAEWRNKQLGKILPYSLPERCSKCNDTGYYNDKNAKWICNH